jgi:hypothetical protein
MRGTTQSPWLCTRRTAKAQRERAGELASRRGATRTLRALRPLSRRNPRRRRAEHRDSLVSERRLAAELAGGERGVIHGARVDWRAATRLRTGRFAVAAKREQGGRDVRGGGRGGVRGAGEARVVSSTRRVGVPAAWRAAALPSVSRGGPGRAVSGGAWGALRAGNGPPVGPPPRCCAGGVPRAHCCLSHASLPAAQR